MSDLLKTVIGILIPFVGTAAGSACVFLMRGEMKQSVQRTLLGFASGVMVAASVFSLLLPAIEDAADLGRLAFLPAAVGTGLGFAFLLLLDNLIPHLHVGAERSEGRRGAASRMSRTMMLCLAVTLHNIPEGMASQSPTTNSAFGSCFCSALRIISGVRSRPTKAACG